MRDERFARVVHRGGQPGRGPGGWHPDATGISVTAVRASGSRSGPARREPGRDRAGTGVARFCRTGRRPGPAGGGRRDQASRRGPHGGSTQRHGTNRRLRRPDHRRGSGLLVRRPVRRTAGSTAQPARIGARRRAGGGDLRCHGLAGGAARQARMPDEWGRRAVRLRRRGYERNLGRRRFESPPDRPDGSVPRVLRRRNRPACPGPPAQSGPRCRRHGGVGHRHQHGVGDASPRRMPGRQRATVGLDDGNHCHRRRRGGSAVAQRF
ncbi:hypothetical protein BZL29_6229 [Mycobacterium kansasii]|uniref:Uncharacterized protein n=1 Tax=Mycobacterium kansasii TaxID=1768 RepID=A0A1V3WRF7_MYCKA|nr:hypothetical protein BZL29_6229 [Mycobacterium kansasii]